MKCWPLILHSFSVTVTKHLRYTQFLGGSGPVLRGPGRQRYLLGYGNKNRRYLTKGYLHAVSRSAPAHGAGLRYAGNIQTLHECAIAPNPERALAGNQFRRGPPKRSPHHILNGRVGSAPLGQHKNHKYEVEVLRARSLGSLHYASEVNGPVNGRDKCTAFCTRWRGGHW